MHSILYFFNKKNQQPKITSDGARCWKADGGDHSIIFRADIHFFYGVFGTSPVGAAVSVIGAGVDSGFGFVFDFFHLT